MYKTYSEKSNKRQIDNLFVGWLIKVNWYYTLESIWISIQFHSNIIRMSICNSNMAQHISPYIELVLVRRVLKLTTIYDDRTIRLIVLVHVHEFNGSKWEWIWPHFTHQYKLQLTGWIFDLSAKGIHGSVIVLLLNMCECVWVCVCKASIYVREWEKKGSDG